MEYDILIVGAGVAGLSAAIRAKQIIPEARIAVLEKGSEVGAHILSGAVLEPRALLELLPDAPLGSTPFDCPVSAESLYYCTPHKHIRLPMPPQMHNTGNYIVSLGNVCRYLAEQAEALGVEIFPGFPAAEVIIEENTVKGIRTGAFGRNKDGSESQQYQPPMEIRAPVTLFAEGARGHLSQQLMQHFDLRSDCDPQTYAIGIKEVWEVTSPLHMPGKVEHTIGWPLESDTYGGSFIYHLNNNQVAIGFVIGLDYSNPHLDPFKEFQRFKHHPLVASLLTGGRRISYGARALNEGGYQSIPKLTMPGAAIIGCAAGFMNVPKIKGTHTAMKSGMLAAESACKALETSNMQPYEDALQHSWVMDELRAVRNIRPAFRYGLWAGLAISALEILTRGKLPYTLHHHADHEQLKPSSACKAPHYPAPDGMLSFDRMSSVYLSSTNHREDEPCHLQLKDPFIPIAHNHAIYDAPEQRYCPAGVYEIIEEAGEKRLQINAQNCVHCKTCDIKDPTQNIVWVTPEGGGGPNYSQM